MTNAQQMIAAKIRFGTPSTQLIYRLNGRLGLISVWTLFKLVEGFEFEGRKHVHTEFHRNPCLPPFWCLFWFGLRKIKYCGIDLQTFSVWLDYLKCQILGRLTRNRAEHRSKQENSKRK